MRHAPIKPSSTHTHLIFLMQSNAIKDRVLEKGSLKSLPSHYLKM
ncbi:hypothetical protein VCHA51O444_10655 [Vibrio chagasii]|nr:hypothetical protein VCHA51O444_10655 [Vibrio chagasii]